MLFVSVLVTGTDIMVGSGFTSAVVSGWFIAGVVAVAGTLF